MTLTDERVPFTSLDEAVHLLDTPAEPWSIQLEIRVTGAIDEDRLRAAIPEGLARHPMARAKLLPAPRTDKRWTWTITAAPDLDPLKVVDCAGDAELDATRAELHSLWVPWPRARPCGCGWPATRVATSSWSTPTTPPSTGSGRCRCCAASPGPTSTSRSRAPASSCPRPVTSRD